VELRKRSGNDVMLPFRIAAWTRRLHVDILHARGSPTLVETAVAGYAARVPRTVYGFHGKTVAELGRKSARRRLAEMTVPRLYDAIVTLTDSMKADLTRTCRLDAARVRVIPNGVDGEVFRPIDRRAALPAESGPPRDVLILGTVGRLDPVKSHGVIIRALARLRACGTDAFLLLIGEGPERPRLEREIRESGLAGQVRLFGHTDRVRDVLNCLDIYVQASLYEGFSNTVLEAMACGLPVVATRTGGTVDLLRDGHEGYLFEPDDDPALTALLLELRHRDRRREMGPGESSTTELDAVRHLRRMALVRVAHSRGVVRHQRGSRDRVHEDLPVLRAVYRRRDLAVADTALRPRRLRVVRSPRSVGSSPGHGGQSAPGYSLGRRLQLPGGRAGGHDPVRAHGGAGSRGLPSKARR